MAMKNLTVVNFEVQDPEPINGGFMFANPMESQRYYDLELRPEEDESGGALFDEAEITVKLDQNLYDGWVAGGGETEQLRSFRENEFLITGPNAKLKNIQMEPEEFGMVDLQFNFLTQEVTDKETYLYHAVQRSVDNNEIMGGESYQINKQSRSLFTAKTTSDLEVDKEEDLALNAELIGEPAEYNWYDAEGNLIYNGADFDTAVAVGEEYQLEVIALADGYKDYEEVELKYKPNRITSLSPNPTKDQLDIDYKINEGETAYIAVTSINQPTSSDNHILKLNKNTTTIDLADKSSGTYVLTLMVDGEVADSKNVIKN